MAFNADYGGVTPKQGGGGGYLIQDKGPFLAFVETAEQKVSKSGNPYVKMDWVIATGKYAGKKVRFQCVTFLPKGHKMAGLSLHVLKQLRQPFEGKFAVTPENWVGKHAYITLGIEQDIKGRDQNKVLDVQAPSVAELQELDETPAQWQLLGEVEKKSKAQADGEAVAALKKPKPEPAPEEEDQIPF